jgi:hypothetical protein
MARLTAAWTDSVVDEVPIVVLLVLVVVVVMVVIEVSVMTGVTVAVVSTMGVPAISEAPWSASGAAVTSISPIR